jgi:HemK-related putative methylase
MSEVIQAQALQCAQLLSSRPRGALLDSVLSRALSLAYRVRGFEHYDDYRLERVHGMPVLVTPSVFNPQLLRTGAYFAGCLDAAVIAPTAEVLDLGTGSGVCALFAARHARRVVAVDINPAAVRCAQLNAVLNSLERRIEVRGGDLFAPVKGEQFDLVLFNPPFVRGTPRNDRDRAWRAEDVAERFAAQLAEHLKPAGCALVLLSSFGDSAAFVSELARHGFVLAAFAQRRFVGERVVIFRAVRP